MNPFSYVWSSLKHLGDQARRLGNAFGAVAEQVESRIQTVDAQCVSADRLPERNGRKTLLKNGVEK